MTVQVIVWLPVWVTVQMTVWMTIWVTVCVTVWVQWTVWSSRVST